MSAATVNVGDTAWVLVSAALVMLMVPGLFLFYGGLVRGKNSLNTIMMSVGALGVVTLQWVLLGYSLSFGADQGGLLGGLDFVGFRGVGPDEAPSAAVPHVAFAMYQCAFAVITVALITGAFAERIRFGAFVAFSRKGSANTLVVQY